MSAKKSKPSIDEGTRKIIAEGVKQVVASDNALRTRIDPRRNHPQLSLHIGRILFKSLMAQNTCYIIKDGKVKQVDASYCCKEGEEIKQVDAVAGAEYSLAASFLIHHIKNDTPAELNRMFNRIIEMKRNEEKTRSKSLARDTFLANALKEFLKSRAGKDWKAVDFRNYAIKKSFGVSIIPPLPQTKSYTGWQRHYEKLGIRDRVSRTGKPCIPKGK